MGEYERNEPKAHTHDGVEHEHRGGDHPHIHDGVASKHAKSTKSSAKK